MATQTDYSWAAGFFDGEGCVSLSLRKHKYAALVIKMAQKDRVPLEKFKAIFELETEIGTTYRNGVPYYELVICSKVAATVLTLMLPYLSLKAPVAKIGLDLQATIDKYSFADRSKGIPSHEMEYRTSLVKQAHWYNSGRWAAAETKPEDASNGEAIVRTAQMENVQSAAEMPVPSVH